MMMMMIIEPLRGERVFVLGGGRSLVEVVFLGGGGIALAAVLTSWLFDRIR